MARDPEPRSELTLLERSLRERGLAAGYVLRGAERYFRARALDLVVALARANSLELCPHDPRDADFRAQRVLDDLASPALFASGRCVVLTEPEAWLRKEASAGSALERALASFLRSKRGTLVLAGDALRADGAAVKSVLAAGGELHSFRKLYERPAPWQREQDPHSAELVQFVLGLARERGLRLAPERALLLVHAKGNDLAALDGALAELATGGATAEASALGASGPGSTAEVADALLAGTPANGLRAIETLFRGGVRKEKDGGRETSADALTAILLGYLRPRVRQGLAASSARERGCSPEEAADEAGIPAYDKGLRALAVQRPSGQWRAMLDDLLDLERRGRSGAAIDASELARLALRWARTPARARSPHA